MHQCRFVEGRVCSRGAPERFLQERGVTVVHPETLCLKDQLEIYLGAKALIVAEGSAQHGLELLGVHPDKPIVVICRRPPAGGHGLATSVSFSTGEVRRGDQVSVAGQVMGLLGMA